MALPQRVLVTGGTGMIGRALVAALVERGVQVVVLSRHPERHRGRLPASVTLERWQAHDQALVPLLARVDAVVNLMGANIAAGRWTHRRKQELYASRVHAGQTLAQAWKRASPRPQVLLQMSAVGYYGHRGDQWVTEDTSPGQDFLARLCVDWEASTREVEDLGARRVVMRTGIVLSPQGGALPRLALPVRLGVGGPLGRGEFYMPWIHIQDQVQAMLFLLENTEARGVYNLCSPNPVTNLDFVRTLGRVLKRPVWFRVPLWALRLVLGELAQALTTSIRAIPQRLLRTGFTFTFPELEPALQDLLTPTPAPR